MAGVCLADVLRSAEANMKCAPAGAALCSHSRDLAVIQKPEFATQLLDAGAQAFLAQLPGKEALGGVIGQGTLSEDCLACQGEAIDCATQQHACFQYCAESVCGHACRSCIQASCDVQKACGGVPGQTLQLPYTCPNPNNPMSMVLDRAILSVKFRGACRYHLDSVAATSGATATAEGVIGEEVGAIATAEGVIGEEVGATATAEGVIGEEVAHQTGGNEEFYP
eukprot:TRINITY_DN6565_c0_g1_i1.p1 TRINITY_DN6565_c0_g1~~TRINITY_DN6565_c0_g1_i1.p1  ORF type:complete len:256 (+),score=28.44 TRINITY_DN6565_c0_g1_i1:98-769(+)